AFTAAAQAVEAGSVPFTTSNNVIILPVTVNGSPPLDFILDTGASGTVISEDAAARLKLAPGKKGGTTTQGGEVDSSALGKADLAVGRMPIGSIDLTAIDMRPLYAGFGRRIDGILGYDVFARFTVAINYET